MDYLLLKWGTVKAWEMENNPEAFNILKKYMKEAPYGCAFDHPSYDRKNLLCQVIDKFDGEIQLDWTGEKVEREKAKKYIRDYGKS